MSWKDSIKPVQRIAPKILIQRESKWRDTISPMPPQPKEFSLDEHKEAIHALIKQYVERNKAQFKGEPGKPGVGKDGNHGATWLFSDEAPAKQGNDGDFCLCENGDVYLKDSGEWVKKLSLKVKGETRYIGGGVTEDRVNQLISANGGGSGASTVIATTTTNLTLTTQTHLIIKGAGGITIDLKAIATATEPVTIKNRSSSNCTIEVDGGGDIDDDSGFIIPPGHSYTFIPETGAQYYVA